MKTVLLGLICAIAGVGTAAAQAPAKADREAQKRVLILYTLRKNMPFTSILERVYQKTLSDGLAGRLDYYAEYIDVARFPEPGYQAALRDFLRRKYAEQRFDLIIASGNATFEFVARHGAELFPGAPVVFSGYGDLPPIPNSTGLIITLDMRSTLDLALRLQPEIKRVFVVCGVSGVEKYFESIARRQFQEYEGRLAFTYLTKLPLEDLQGVVANAPEDSIIYFLSLLEDGAGNKFIPLNALDKISSVANVPVYSWYDVTVDHGIVGGSLISAEVVARQTAELALRALRGENPDRIPVVEIRPNINIFDWRQLQRWGISEDRLPPGSIVRFRGPSFWEHYKWRIIGVVSLCIVEGVLIFALLAQRARRRRVEETLRDNEERLKLALSAANMGAWDWRRGADELNWSDEMRQIFGLTNGKSAVTPELFFDLIHPDDRPAVSQAITRASNEGAPYDVEFRTIHQDGSMHWVMGKGKALLDKAGQAARMLGVNMDITDRKRAEERLRSYFELPLIGMAITSPDRRFVEVNQKLCDILGYSMDQLTGMSWVEVTHPDDVAENIRLLDETLRGETEGYVMDKRFIHRGGHIVYTSISARCVRRADRTVDYLALVVQEITERKQAEDALRRSEARYRTIIEDQTELICRLLPDGRYTFVNEAYCRYFGRSLEELIGHTFLPFVPAEEHERIHQFFAAITPSNPVATIEHRVVLPDGGVRWNQWTDRGIFDEQGRLLEFQCVGRDITQRKQAEEALRLSEDKFSKAFRSSPDAFAISRQADGMILEVNDRWEEILGYARDEAVGRTAWELQIYLDPGERERLVSLVRERGYARDFEVDLRKKSGEIRNVLISAEPIMIHDEPCLTLIVRDITERKRAGEALRESEERLRLALEAGRMGVWEWDTRTNALKWSKETYTIMGLPPFSVEPDYHIWAERVRPDDLPGAMGAIRKAIEEKAEYRCEYRITWPDGSVRWVGGRGKPVYDEDGQCLKVSGLIVDITERMWTYLRLNIQYAISRILSEAASVADAAPRLLQTICESLDWEFGEIWRVDREADHLTCLENWSKPSRELAEFASASRQFTVPPGVGLPGRVWKSRQPAWITDIANDSNFPRASLAQRAGLHGGFGFPALLGDEAVGVMVFFSREVREPDEDLLRMMASIGSQIEQFIERKQAEEALRESEEALRKSYTRIEDLAGRLIAAQEEERRHIARELHDDLNQQVAALAIGISRLKRQFPDAGAAVQEQFARLREKTDWLSECIRQVSHELHSSILQHAGLPAALNSYCAEFSDREGIAVTLDIRDGADAAPPDAALCIYRVAQEALRNVARHSGARSAIVALARVNGAIELRVTDQGVGFDPGQAQEGRGLGLVSMEERVKLLHGNFVLTTRPGAGTELRAQIPLRGEHEQNKGLAG